MPAEAVWSRLEAHLARLAPEVLDDLAPGASDADLDRLDAATGLALPTSARDAYRVHDGQLDEAPGLFFGLRFLSASEAAEEWARWASVLDDDPDLVNDIEVTAHPEGAVEPVYASRAWLPIASDGAGNHLALDTAPGPEGTAGQVISFGADEPVRYVLAPSLPDFLAWCAERIEAGEATPVDGGLRLGSAGHLLDVLPERFGR